MLAKCKKKREQPSRPIQTVAQVKNILNVPFSVDSFAVASAFPWRLMDRLKNSGQLTRADNNNNIISGKKKKKIFKVKAVNI